MVETQVGEPEKFFILDKRKLKKLRVFLGKANCYKILNIVKEENSITEVVRISFKYNYTRIFHKRNINLHKIKVTVSNFVDEIFHFLACKADEIGYYINVGMQRLIVALSFDVPLYYRGLRFFYCIHNDCHNDIHSRKC